MSFKISYLELCWPSCSVEQNHMSNFGGGHYGEHLKFGYVVQEMSFKEKFMHDRQTHDGRANHNGSSC